MPEPGLKELLMSDTTYCDARQLAAEIEEFVFLNEKDVARVATVLRVQADRLDVVLQAANDLSASMDPINKDRQMLASEVAKLRAERDYYRNMVKESDLLLDTR